MSSSPSNARKFWEHCIFGTMFARNHCNPRPYLYFTESGSVVLDARPVYPAYETVTNAIATMCDLIAKECGFSQDMSVSVAGLYVWKEGGAS